MHTVEEKQREKRSLIIGTITLGLLILDSILNKKGLLEPWNAKQGKVVAWILFVLLIVYVVCIPFKIKTIIS